jgi:hypothetical protein
VAGRLVPIANWLLNAARQIGGMHGNPEFRHWAATLAGFGEMEDLRPLRGVLVAIGQDALRTPDPLNEFLERDASQVPFSVYAGAAQVAERAVDDAPEASFVLSLLALMGWSRLLGNSLYRQRDGVPHAGWKSLPYACALASMKLGVLDGAQDLTAHAYDVLMSAKYYVAAPVAEAIARYRTLGRRIEERYETSVGNLADDLRESLRGDEPSFRADLGAILWTLGLVPESRVFEAGRPTSVVPSRRLCRLIVWRSLGVLQIDPLVQYLWLGLKDRPPFNIRDHESLFYQINLLYSGSLLDSGFEVPTSRVYAETLVGWFRGSLSLEQAEEYLSRFEVAQGLFPEIDWSVYVRMELLAHMVASPLGILPRKLKTRDGMRQRRYALVDLSRRVTVRTVTHPEWPALHTRMSGPLFTLIANELSTFGQDTRPVDFTPEALMTALEELRASGLSYWLHVTPPTPTTQEAQRAASELAREGALLDRLRGAYFMMLYPLLPMHFRRFTHLLSGGAPIDPDPEVGRQHYQELRDELAGLYKKMHRLAPEYTAKRLRATAGLSDLVRALGSHAHSRQPERAKRSTGGKQARPSAARFRDRAGGGG